MSTSSNIIASVCMATHNREKVLPHVLESILRQETPFRCEVIVVDDSSTDNTPEVVAKYPVMYVRLERGEGYRNPSLPRNVAYKLARGDVIIAQSDDVVHATDDAIFRLVRELAPNTFSLAHVRNTDLNGVDVPIGDAVVLTGTENPRPFFFLGAIFREHVYAIGGNDERFDRPGYDDSAFGAALMSGLGLSPVYSSVVGWHIDHSRPSQIQEDYAVMAALFAELHDRRVKGVESWVSPGGPWPYEPQRGCTLLESPPC